MDLTLQRDDPLNDTFTLPDGRPLYTVSSTAHALHANSTALARVDQYGRSAPLGSIVRHSFHASEVTLGERRIAFKESGLGVFSSSETFTASNGLAYKWKISHDTPMLLRGDHSNIQVATYVKKSAHAHTPASLHIAPEGVPIVDDIVLTFAYFEAKRRENNETAQYAAIGAAGAGS